MRVKELEDNVQKLTDKYIKEIDKASRGEIQGDHDRVVLEGTAWVNTAAVAVWQRLQLFLHDRRICV